MSLQLRGLARSAFRHVVPARLRRWLWDVLARRYYEYNSIRGVVRHVETTINKPAAQVAQLVSLLRESRYRVHPDQIKRETGLDLKAFSNQDLIAFLYFNGRRTGFFVDIGAFDGVAISNTFALEQLGWEGICVEPIPEVFTSLQNNRHCHLVNAALAASSGANASFLRVSGQLGLSGLEQQMPARIRQGLTDQGLEVDTISVNTVTFQEVMEGHPEVTYIDFLSIDVEGGELEVLGSIDFSRFRFGLITIENNAGSAQLLALMARHGYVIFLDLGVDLMFVPAQ